MSFLKGTVGGVNGALDDVVVTRFAVGIGVEGDGNVLACSRRLALLSSAWLFARSSGDSPNMSSGGSSAYGSSVACSSSLSSTSSAG